MKREILLERIDKLKKVMPWYVLEYYHRNWLFHTVLPTCTKILKEYDQIFLPGSWNLVFRMLTPWPRSL